MLFTGLAESGSHTIEQALWRRLRDAGFTDPNTVRLEWLDPQYEAGEEEFVPAPVGEQEILPLIAQEQKRSERCGRTFVMAVVGRRKSRPIQSPDELIMDFVSALGRTLHPFDTVGWLEYGHRIAVIFAESDVTGRHIARLGVAMSEAAERCSLDPDSVQVEVFPDPQSALLEPERGSRWEQAVKRGIDVCGSALGILALSPVFAAIAVAVKVTSPGPVFFRQTRTGRHGREFTFFKFRSMQANNDPREHERFVAALIEGKKPADGSFKLKGDSRITRIGGFLRKTSLDELPQLYNVLRGDMSLVGPRPPIPYEVQKYSLWHRRRLYAAQPGMTGLWQVEGRSRVGFDEMVRLDLKYASTWSIWLDIRILLRTPKAVVGGNGAR